MKNKFILSCLLAALVPGLAQAVPQAGKGPRGIDTNGDGIITKAEATAGGATRLAENFAAIDTDGNGELTREEMRAHHMERRKEGRDRAQNADTDGNRAISLDEAKAADMKRLVENFSNIDKNGDGEVSRDEMQAFRQDKRAQMKGEGPGKGDGQGKGKGPGQGKGPQN